MVIIRFIYLDIADQGDFDAFKTAQILKKVEGTHRGKSIGYLYAMLNGAEVILDLDPDQEPIPVDESGRLLPIETKRAVYSRPLLFQERENAEVYVRRTFVLEEFFKI